MLETATSFAQLVLAVHILAVLAAFGVVLGYPLILLWAARLDPRSLPLLHDVRVMIGRSLVNPGLALVLIAGIYLASKWHQWHEFYVQWGLGVAFVLGGLEGALVIRGERRLAELARRDVAASAGGEGEVTWSAEYAALRASTGQVTWVMSVLIVTTVVLMTVR